ncbi:hypothetical protein TREES_T100019206 [Tupaia chinensis]|uniref:Uncharacterized protein n=1 Tax=Tupaia chinensis TaxID=246437 RepID=L9L9X5_TUPCH|nr:hypothetical protein TREES_T100019206 [Tupaia chinensis]
MGQEKGTVAFPIPSRRTVFVLAYGLVLILDEAMGFSHKGQGYEGFRELRYNLDDGFPQNQSSITECGATGLLWLLGAWKVQTCKGLRALMVCQSSRAPWSGLQAECSEAP